MRGAGGGGSSPGPTGPSLLLAAAECGAGARCKGESLAGQKPSPSLKINVSLSGSKQTPLLCVLQAVCSEGKDSSGYWRRERRKVEGDPGFPTENPSVRWSDPKSTSIPFDTACVQCMC